tara:strand:- start:42 stop:638 length:597 start_codon:yes stop_codon:yes gene_type:complete
MNRKLITQSILFLIIIGIIFIIFFSYFFEKKLDINKANNVNVKNNSSINQNKSNLIKDLEYSTSDANGNQYNIKSKFGEISLLVPEEIFMTDVTANINIVDDDPINITSKYAIYNSTNFQTNFYEDVLIIYLDNEVTSEKMDLDFEKNIGILTENIIYKSPNLELLADKVEVDLLTKDSKIFMFEESKKVKIFGDNDN